MTSYQLLLSWPATRRRFIETPVDLSRIHDREQRERLVEHTRPSCRDKALIDFVWATKNLANVVAGIWRARVVEVDQ